MLREKQNGANGAIFPRQVALSSKFPGGSDNATIRRTQDRHTALRPFVLTPFAAASLRPVFDGQSGNGVKITITLTNDGAVAQAERNGGNLRIDLLNDAASAPQFGVKFSVKFGSISGEGPEAEQVEVTLENIQILVASRTVLDACVQFAQHPQANSDPVAHRPVPLSPARERLACETPNRRQRWCPATNIETFRILFPAIVRQCSPCLSIL